MPVATSTLATVYKAGDYGDNKEKNVIKSIKKPLTLANSEIAPGSLTLQNSSCQILQQNFTNGDSHFRDLAQIVQPAEHETSWIIFEAVAF